MREEENRKDLNIKETKGENKKKHTIKVWTKPFNNIPSLSLAGVLIVYKNKKNVVMWW